MAGAGSAIAPARREAVPEIDISAMTIVRPRRWGRIAAVAIMLALIAWLAKAFAEGQIAWEVTGEYLFWPSILMGVV
ncbi:MAG: hypothetical protein ACU0DT_19225, partial [Albimonas sp.]|uniref:hypothetical protein n=1 Tax=Albimonas sp. TaxID=1872425 RepID=UPI004056997A